VSLLASTYHSPHAAGISEAISTPRKKKTVLCVQVNESSLIHQQVVPLVDHLVGRLVDLLEALDLDHLLEGLPEALVERLEAWGPDHPVDLLGALDLDRLLEVLPEA